MRKKLAAVIFAAAVALGGCTAEEINQMPLYGDGSLPVEERQSLEEFISTVEPHIVEFMQTLDAEGANVYLPRSAESYTESCGYPIFGYRLKGPMLFGKAVPEDKLLEIYEQQVKPLGFDRLYHSSDEVNTSYKWFNTQDGGFVSVTLFPDGDLVARYASGCRPYHGAGKPEHVRTAWEQELISRQSPTPDPSESPTSNKTAIGGK
ncbi:DUF4853 domain-containing protein [Buchananella hordeovulneris]|uniref:DUF4853 domain-containing protein n=1 Tax=Buchananella hordeovulneris TaxID=52770 RepID=A0A1Q5PUK8_9ACTO|nr:DUF4853 domain-containing protein [Buchananella hordeovulneris]OKL51283.1 hypothetical protein BSZ40_08210 [Buchananella hordeovulneris]